MVLAIKQVAKKSTRGLSLVGRRYGLLTVIRLLAKRRNGERCWLCRCDCGKTCKVRHGHLVAGGVQSCGCLRGKNDKSLRALAKNQKRIREKWKRVRDSIVFEDKRWDSCAKVAKKLKRDRKTIWKWANGEAVPPGGGQLRSHFDASSGFGWHMAYFLREDWTRILQAMKAQPSYKGEVLTQDAAERLGWTLHDLYDRAKRDGIKPQLRNGMNAEGERAKRSYVPLAWLEKCANPNCRDGDEMPAVNAEARPVSALTNGVESVWLTIAEAHAISGINTGVISRAASAGEIVTNGEEGRARRLEATSFTRWHLARAHRPENEESAARISRLLTNTSAP